MDNSENLLSEINNLQNEDEAYALVTRLQSRYDKASNERTLLKPFLLRSRVAWGELLPEAKIGGNGSNQHRSNVSATNVAHSGAYRFAVNQARKAAEAKEILGVDKFEEYLKTGSPSLVGLLTLAGLKDTPDAPATLPTEDSIKIAARGLKKGKSQKEIREDINKAKGETGPKKQAARDAILIAKDRADREDVYEGTPRDWQDKSPKVRKRELTVQEKNGDFDGLHKIHLELARWVNSGRAIFLDNGVAEYDLSDVSEAEAIRVATILLDDIMSAEIMLARMRRIMATHAEKEKVHRRIKKLRDDTGRTAEEKMTYEAMADKLELDLNPYMS